MNKKAILIITDGIGYDENEEYNAFAMAKTPTYDMLFSKYPNSKIKTSGKAVGLPEGQMGNSEVGHMSIGSGRVIYQSLVQISASIKDGSLFEMNEYKKIKENSNDIHIIGLLSDGGVHSLDEHIKSVAKKCGENRKVYLHIISDGRDVSPQSIKVYIDGLSDTLSDNITIASISGRFYAMDRDNRWERVQEAYEAINNANNKQTISINQYIDSSYKQKIYDEFIIPACFGDYEGVKENSNLIFCNFRSDRMKELVAVYNDNNFNGFITKKINTHILTMTSYSDKLDCDVWIKKEDIQNTLSEVISHQGLKQFHISETEKYAHVTFFLNGGRDAPFQGEERKLIPSMDVRTYDEAPHMRAKEIADGIIGAMNDKYDYIVANFANGDMVGHTGNFEAGIKAVEAVDKSLGRILKANDNDNDKYNIIITSDHGNCEKMRDNDGKMLTNHTTTDVFCFCISDEVKTINNGALSNIAPSILKLMNIKAPSEMDDALF